MYILNEVAELGIYVLLFIISVVAIITVKPRVLWYFSSALNFLNPAPIAPIPLVPSQVLSFGSILKFTKSALTMFRAFIPWALILLALTYALLIPRSVSKGSGVYGVITILAILMMIGLAVIAQQHPGRSTGMSLLRGTMITIAPLTVVQAVTTIIFRVSPELENRYFTSQVFIFLLGDDARLLFTERPNNVLDPLKAGGLLFVNGNRASMVMAVLGLLYLSLWFERRSTWMVLLALTSFTGALFTNSKTATILTVVIPILFFIMPSTVRAGKNQGAALLGSVFLVGLGAVFWRLGSQLPKFIAGIDEATGSRASLFSAAARYFQESPFLGLGFGGWAEHWAADADSFNLPPRLPPHNFLILEWANGGLIAVALILAIILRLSLFLIGQVRTATTTRQARSFSFQLAALAWMFAHGMYDNTAFYGTSNTMFIFAVLVAQTVTTVQGPQEPEPSSVDEGLGAEGRVVRVHSAEEGVR